MITEPALKTLRKFRGLSGRQFCGLLPGYPQPSDFPSLTYVDPVVLDPTSCVDSAPLKLRGASDPPTHKDRAGVGLHPSKYYRTDATTPAIFQPSELASQDLGFGTVQITEV